MKQQKRTFAFRCNARKQFGSLKTPNMLMAFLFWEINYIESAIDDSSLVQGFSVEIPEGYDKERGWIALFCFSGGGEGSEKNTIQILERDADRLLIRLTAEIIDVNFYDDSKPRSKVIAETWFERDPDIKRSMQ